MKVVILTSNQLRHKFFINYIASRYNVSGVVMEAKKRDVKKKKWLGPYTKIAENYFLDRDKSEERFFGEFSKLPLPSEKILEIAGGQVNKDFVIDKIKGWGFDIILVFGASLLQDEIIDLAGENKIINLHLGLSPYYRGSGTNFWPLYNEEPQYVGCTIHFLDKGIDSGSIIIQGQPEIELGDTPHSLGNKTIVKGAELMSQVVLVMEEGKEVKGAEQDLSPSKLCLFNDCSAEHIAKVEEKFRNGLIEKYLEKKDSLPKVKLVNILEN